MNRNEAVFLAVAQTLSDHHIDIRDLFDGDDKDFVNNLINENEQTQKDDTKGEIVGKYKNIATDLLWKLREHKQRRGFFGEDWGSAYADMGDIFNKEELND